MNPIDINVILSQMAEMQKQLSELQTLKQDVKEIKQINSFGEDVAKEKSFCSHDWRWCK
jgi:hypothetical protein